LASVRYLAFQAPFVLLLIAAGIQSLDRLKRVVAVSALAFMIGFFLIAYYASPGSLFGYPLKYAKENWPGAAGFIRASKADTVLVAPGFMKIPLARYSLGTARIVEVPHDSSTSPDLPGARRVALVLSRIGRAQEVLLRGMDANHTRLAEVAFHSQNLIRVVIYDTDPPPLMTLYP
jgi:hypothetical protein